MIRAPFVGAIVQVRTPNTRRWVAAIVTELCDSRQFLGARWIETVNVSIFRPNGGVLPARFVSHIAASADHDAESEIYEWRWPEEPSP